jgi:hypothetical protein
VAANPQTAEVQVLDHFKSLSKASKVFEEADKWCLDTSTIFVVLSSGL